MGHLPPLHQDSGPHQERPRRADRGRTGDDAIKPLGPTEQIRKIAGKLAGNLASISETGAMSLFGGTNTGLAKQAVVSPRYCAVVPRDGRFSGVHVLKQSEQGVSGRAGCRFNRRLRVVCRDRCLA